MTKTQTTTTHQTVVCPGCYGQTTVDPETRVTGSHDRGDTNDPTMNPCVWSGGTLSEKYLEAQFDYHRIENGRIVAADPAQIVVSVDANPTTPVGDLGLDGPYATADSIGYGLAIYYTADREGVVVCIDYVGGPASAQPTKDTMPLFVATVENSDHIMAAWRVASRWMADRVADDVDSECGFPTATYIEAN